MTREHDLVKTGDKDSFKSIQDRNGEVALKYCRVCKCGEGKLKPTCPGKQFLFEVEGSAALHVDEIWPDGNAPENPTLDDVLAVIKRDGGAFKIIRDWDLDVDLRMTVSDEKDQKYVP